MSRIILLYFVIPNNYLIVVQKSSINFILYIHFEMTFTDGILLFEYKLKQLKVVCKILFFLCVFFLFIFSRELILYFCNCNLQFSYRKLRVI
jgi:hypothetical protein